MQLFTTQYINNGQDSCGFLWGFYQLFRLSFWRHPFTAEGQNGEYIFGKKKILYL